MFVVVSAEVADRSRKQQLQALNLLVLLLPAVHRNVLQVRHHRRYCRLYLPLLPQNNKTPTDKHSKACTGIHTCAR